MDEEAKNAVLIGILCGTCLTVGLVIGILIPPTLPDGMTCVERVVSTGKCVAYRLQKPNITGEK